MNKGWWISKKELDKDQLKFISLPADGKFSLVGPPGSGKTNLLLLRAQYLAGAGEKNVLVITYTKTLAEFIRAGIGATGLISPAQVRTFHSWAYEYILDNTGKPPKSENNDFDEGTRRQYLESLQQTNKNTPTSRLYDAIFVDEAQDFSVEELECLLCLSEKICICGDSRQGIYNRDGLDVAEKLKLEKHVLRKHYRIGQKIARVADGISPAENDSDSLETTCNYNPESQGASSANMHSCSNRDEQFQEMLAKIKIELDAFKGESIGVVCGKKETCVELRRKFDETDISNLVCVHGIDEDVGFKESLPIHVITLHSSKGTEFRTVHIYGAEELKKYPFRRTKLIFTAVTRPRTALNIYRSGETNMRLESALAEPQCPDVDALFPGDE